MKNLAIEAEQKDAPLSHNYFKLVKYWIALGVFSFFAMAIIFTLMVFKPAFEDIF